MKNKLMNKRFKLMFAHLIALLILSATMAPAIHAETKKNDLKNLQTDARHLAVEKQQFLLAQRYLEIYLNSDTGRAKSLYLFLSNRVDKIKALQTEIEHQFEHMPTANQAQAEPIVSQAISDYFDTLTLYTDMEHRLRQRIVNIDQLREYAEFIDTEQPLLDIIEGRLDSDLDGTADHVELGGNRINPISEQ